MSSPHMARRRLVALFREIATADGQPDLLAVPSLRAASRQVIALRAILDASGFDFSHLVARLEADPDVMNLSRRRRVEALIDYARVAIGLLDRELSAKRGHLIVSANED